MSRAATADLRRLLHVLADPTSPAPTAPAVSLADIPSLVARARGEGLRVSYRPPGRAVAPSAALVAVNVVREALANVARHAGPTDVEVDLALDAGALRVRVRDAGPEPGWTAHPGSGHGLALLRTRVEAQGGRLHAGPRAGGFEVEALLPLTDADE